MSCNPHNYPLPAHVAGDNWPGLTWALESITAGDTEFGGTLTLAEFELKNSAGTTALLLTSATAAVTIEVATPDQWSVSVEERVLDITPGTYTYGLRLTDDANRPKTVVAGTLQIKTPPVS
jgi:hypothetical protein